MNAAIFSFVKVSENSMVASVRIARFISNHFGIPIYTDQQINQELDLLIIVNGAYGFSKHLASLAGAARRARRVVWVQNDYTIIPPKKDSQGVSPFRAVWRERDELKLPHMDFWTTCHDWSSFTENSRYVNWNALTFDENYDPAVISQRRNSNSYSNLLYYGSFRGGGGKSSRERYFDRYFADPQVHTIISSPAKQFREKYTSDRIQHEGAILEGFFEKLGTCGLGLYIEDRMSHERFHSPANRFYEMLSAGLPMVFQPEAQSMMRKAGYDIEPYIASNSLSIKRLMETREEIGAEQRAKWVDGHGGPAQFRAHLTNTMSEAMDLQNKELS